MTKPHRRTHQVAIKDDMTIYNALSQKIQLLDAFAECEELDLDLSQVGEMDSAGFQLLILAKREALNAGKRLRLVAHSKAVTELLDLYHMASYFGDPMVIPANEQTVRKSV